MELYVFVVKQAVISQSCLLFLRGQLVLLRSGTLSSQFGAVLANGNMLKDSSGMGSELGHSLHCTRRDRGQDIPLSLKLGFFSVCVDFRDTSWALCANWKGSLEAISEF